MCVIILCLCSFSVVDKGTREDKHSSGNMAVEAINNNKTWVKLTGPAAQSLAEAFFEPAVVVLQEILTGDAEERRTSQKEECLMKGGIKNAVAFLYFHLRINLIYVDVSLNTKS